MSNPHDTLVRSLARLSTALITLSNRQAIEHYVEELGATGLSTSYIAKTVLLLIRCAEALGVDFSGVDKSTCIGLIRGLEAAGYAASTRSTYRVIIKRFFRWIHGGTTPECIAWLNTTVAAKDRKLPEELLTVAELNHMVETAPNPRDKALIAVLYDSGCRIGELLGVDLRHVETDRYGAIVLVDGKTGQRRVRIVACVPYLASWLATHPLGDSPDAPLWVSSARYGHARLTHSAVGQMLHRTAADSGITKRVYPHLFRHSRATELAQHLTDQQLKVFFGWTANSKQTGTYVHLADIDAAILMIYGIEREGEQEERLQAPLECPRCGQANPAEAHICNRCGGALDIVTVLEADEEQARLEEFLRDPWVRTLWLRMYGGDEILSRGRQSQGAARPRVVIHR